MRSKLSQQRENLNIQNILMIEEWKVFNLKMTKSGYAIFSNEVQILNKVQTQVYVHVYIDEYSQKNILRIGRAKNGILNRWIKSSNGHGSTFLYAIGESERYRNSATRYPNYLLYFAELYNLNTQLYVLDCENNEIMKNIEQELIKYFNPAWEQFKKPIKNYLELNTDIKNKVTFSGGAIKVLNQKNNIPDIKEFTSNLKWYL